MQMTRRTITLIVIVALLIVGIVDFKINGFAALQNFFKQAEPKIQDIEHQITPDTASFKASESLVFDAQGVKNLKVLNPNGGIEIHGGVDNQITVQANFTVYAKTEKQAKEYSQTFKVQDKRMNDIMQLVLKSKGQRLDNILGVKVDYIITAPETLSLDLEGQEIIKVTNFSGRVQVKNDFGQVEIADIRNDLAVFQGSGWVKIMDVKGNLNLKASYGDVLLQRVTGNVTFETNAGKVEIEEISGSIEGNSSFGKVEGRQITGGIIFTGRAGDVNFANVEGPISITNEFGDVRVVDFTHNVKIISKQGEVYLKPVDLNYQIQAKTQNGNIIASSLQGLELKKEQPSHEELKGVVGAGKYTMHLESSFGSIIIE